MAYINANKQSIIFQKIQIFVHTMKQDHYLLYFTEYCHTSLG